MRGRKKSREILDGIFNILNDGNMHNVGEIADHVGCNWMTVMRWLNMIVKIQNMPKVKMARAGKIYVCWIEDGHNEAAEWQKRFLEVPK